MSEIWKRAENAAKNLEKYPESVISNEIRKLELKQGEFSVDFYMKGSAFFPQLIGMSKNCNLKEKYDNVLSFAKENGLKALSSSDSIILIGPTGKYEGLVGSQIFLASTPEMFEAIGRKIYGLRTE